MEEKVYLYNSFKEKFNDYKIGLSIFYGFMCLMLIAFLIIGFKELMFSAIIIMFFMTFIFLFGISHLLVLKTKLIINDSGIGRERPVWRIPFLVVSYSENYENMKSFSVKENKLIIKILGLIESNLNYPIDINLKSLNKNELLEVKNILLHKGIKEEI